MKKLTLVYPNQHWLKDDIVTTWTIDPRTIAVLAAVVRDIVDVDILDANVDDLSADAFADEIARRAPDYVGISLLTTEYAAILDQAAEIVKRVLPKAVVIAGGVHVTLHPEHVMRNPCIDYACHGEGDEMLRQLILHLEGRGPAPIMGLVHRVDGRVVVQPKATVEDIAKLPWPAYDLIDFTKYTTKLPRHGANRFPELPGMAMIVSRGCPYRCTFCQVAAIAGRAARMRDPQDIVDEIKFVKERYGIRSITFFDDNFFLPKNPMKEFLRLLAKEKLDIKWQAAGAAIWVLDDEFLDLMQETGCVGLTVAIESGVQRVLDNIIDKPIRDVTRIPEMIENIRKRGIWVAANFVIGLPGETWQEIRATVHFAETCNADYVKFYLAVPLHGTRLFDMAKSMGVLDGAAEDVAVDWRFGRILSDEWTPRDVATLRVYEWDRINFQPDRIAKICEIWGTSVEDLNRIRKVTRDSLVF
ncbi:MAG: B12-binding domain-containing radical SAM protein [Alphaproteobacteria bacterium]|nr:B12-binding domain-containing radical SAM protein [Alphaproteobacteria bacterium]